MAIICVTEHIAAPAQAVWELIANFGGTDQWIRGVESVSVTGEGVGAIRTATLAAEQETGLMLENLYRASLAKVARILSS